jgi:hypothetical protein
MVPVNRSAIVCVCYNAARSASEEGVVLYAHQALDAGKRSVSAVALTVALAYLVFTLLGLALHDGNPLWFAWLDDEYWEQAPPGSIGYDGEFVYAIALDGLEATDRLDNPPYRLQRILLPALAHALSLGREALTAWAILGINWLAIVLSSTVLARWLVSEHASPWYALVYAFFVGTLMAYSRDLTEPLMIACAVAGVVAWERGRMPLAALSLASSALAKETALVFILACTVQAFCRRRWRHVLWAAGSVLPMALWQAVLWMRYGRLPLLSGASANALWPLAGILGQVSEDPGRLFALITVALPALWLTLFGALKLTNEPESLVWWLVFLHAFVLLFLPPEVYDHLMHAGRNASGLVASVVLCVPALNLRQRQLAALWFCLPCLIWLVPILRWTPWP